MDGAGAGEEKKEVVICCLFKQQLSNKIRCNVFIFHGFDVSGSCWVHVKPGSGISFFFLFGKETPWHKEHGI